MAHVSIVHPSFRADRMGVFGISMAMCNMIHAVRSDDYRDLATAHGTRAFVPALHKEAASRMYSTSSK